MSLTNNKVLKKNLRNFNDKMSNSSQNLLNKKPKTIPRSYILSTKLLLLQFHVNIALKLPFPTSFTIFALVSALASSLRLHTPLTSFCHFRSPPHPAPTTSLIPAQTQPHSSPRSPPWLPVSAPMQPVTSSCHSWAPPHPNSYHQSVPSTAPGCLTGRHRSLILRAEVRDFRPYLQTDHCQIYLL